MAFSFFFGKPKDTGSAPAPASGRAGAPDPLDTIRQQQEHIDNLQKQLEMHEKRSANALRLAKEYKAKGDERKAKDQLKARAESEKAITRTVAMMDTTRAAMEALKTTNTAKDQARIVKIGLEAMKSNMMKPEELDDLRADMEEALADAQEVNDALGESWAPQVVSADELDEEYAALMADDEAAEVGVGAAPAPARAVGAGGAGVAAGAAAVAAAAAPMPALPAVPTGAVGTLHLPAAPVGEIDMEAELARLEAGLA